jgi:hypothetical protein
MDRHAALPRVLRILTAIGTARPDIDSYIRPNPTADTIQRSLTHLRSRDLNEEWLPDILLHEDQLAFENELILAARARIRSVSFDPPIEVEVPKTPFFSRMGRLITLEERLALHAVLLPYAAALDDRLQSGVFSARLGKSQKWLTKNGVDQWKLWNRHVTRHLRRGEPWLIKTDVISYFDTITHAYLDTELQAIGVPSNTRKTLFAMLAAWSKPGVGLLQGPDMARLLGNLFLSPIDELMSEGPWTYSRYMDDIRITAADKVTVIRAFHELERLCRKRGLLLSPSKTTITHGSTAIHDLLEVERQRATDYLELGLRREAGAVLRDLLRSSIRAEGQVDGRNLRFSLLRLAGISDRYMTRKVFQNLDDLAPASRAVAQYLVNGIAKSSTIDRIRDFLVDDSKVRHDHLVYHLFALLLESPDQLPAEVIAVARSYSEDSGKSIPIRTIAMSVAAHNRDWAVLARLRMIATSRDIDSRLRRGALTALARAGSLDDTTVRAVDDHEQLARTATYLQSATVLPSLISPARTKLRSRAIRATSRSRRS